MRWLHLSDFHVGRESHSTQATALGSLVDAVSVAVTSLLDAILVTGDLANSGKADQYQNFEQTLLAPLRRLPSCAGVPLFVAPGNHDVDCDATLPPSWDSLGRDRQEMFFEESPLAEKLREPRGPAFREYASFLTR